MWKQCNIVARWRAFIGMLLALIAALFFLACPSPPERHIYATMSAHGSYESVRAALHNFDTDTIHTVEHGLEGLDYVKLRIYHLHPPAEMMRISFAVLTIPLALIILCTVIPVVVTILCWIVPA